MEQRQHAKHPPYMWIFFALAVLTALELMIAFFQSWPKMAVILILVGLAVWKALLVALYYMHLRFEPNRLRILVIVPLPLVVILILAVITEYVW